MWGIFNYCCSYNTKNSLYSSKLPILHSFQIDGPYTLRHYLAMAGPDVISVSSNPQAQTILKRVERESTHRYQTLTLPEDGASNLFVVNGTIIHRCKSEAPKSDAVSSRIINRLR